MNHLNHQQNEKFTFSAQQIALVGVFMGIGIALSQFVIRLGPTNRLSLVFIATAAVGMLYGPWVGGFAAAGVDLLTGFIFGIPGGFFIGFTFTAFVNGFIYGSLLHRKNITWQRVLWVTILQTVISNLLLNTLWVNLLYQTPVIVLLASRIPQNLIMAPIRFVLLYVITQNRQLKQVFNRYATYRQ